MPDRLYHWLMAACVLALLATSFLPILGIQFAWVMPHWIAGLVLTAAIVFHIARALIWQDPKSMLIGARDLRDAWWSTRRTLGVAHDEPGKPGKYELLQKLYHHLAAVVILVAVGTGLIMLAKIDSPLWERNPYLLSDGTWGVIYVAHGLAALSSITLIIAHVYFALRPEKRWLTRSMIFGWITRAEYLEQHDSERWTISEEVRR